MNCLKALSLAFALAFFAATPVSAAEITVSAAASLADAFTELQSRFESEHPAVTVRTNFAASTPLLRQIIEGAPVALFASADQTSMDKAEAFIVPGSRRTFASNSLVLITPADQTAIQALGDLSSAKRIAIGNPDSVPAGRYAREVLTASDLWDALTLKFIPGNSVRQVLDYVSRGEVDAGIVYATDAKSAGSKIRVAAVLSGHTPVTYPLALIKPETAEARAFADFVFSPTGQGILVKHGFITN